METAFTRLVGCRRPLQLASMPAVATVELVAAVARAGALAMMPGVGIPGSLLARLLDEAADAAGTRVGVNFLMPFVDRDAVRAAAPKARVVEFFYGDPDADLVAIAHDAGALASWQVGSVEEATAAAAAGCDMVVAQGTGAGGHVRGRGELLPLVAAVLDAVDVPVVGAGGIGTARDMADVLSAGASAVRVGTRFIASREAGAHPDYVRAVVAAGAGDTELTEAFSVGWPDALHRVLSSCVRAAASLDEELTGEDVRYGVKFPIPRFSTFPPSRDATGRIDAFALYAGVSVAAVRDVQPAADIVAELCDGAEKLLGSRTRTTREES
ncbi:MAG TPA: nitronate monooxygenase [Candidatus Binatia bacterium]|jgi:NAD(P)H-dependent flavin oxidoreductase YrpB (nitropropane dioxygenase family)